MYVYIGGNNFDITPIRSSITTSGTFSTAASSTRISVSVTNHGASKGDYFTLVSSTTVGGNLVFNDAHYEVLSATDNNFTFTTTVALRQQQIM